ncbi:MAG TPA: glucuronate isomerase [Bacteroidales bacterium]|mgnify:CR=1 FL=1|nr:glucuronate isomerase [Bacteroidales bacterium]HQG35744.1 glucuronate isomerase [Bacteroidales bacterium]HQG52302.1 glucuronate isomerase [Bacteroidales bacterium]HQJ19798.1 glucuronate isomerase [Bacteroidales bacterium]
MSSFIHPDFLLNNKTAIRLYHQYSENLPIIDFHCHLSPQWIATDRQFENIAQIWLEGDHYKWRAMRTNGVNEKFCTGNASPEEKFKKWAETVPYTIGNPLYHWTHLELARYFGIYDLLSPITADRVYNEATERLRGSDFSTRSLIKKMNVEVICTTDDPSDTLEFHKQMKENFDVKVLPAFRPDAVIKIEDHNFYRSYIEKLGRSADIEIKGFDSLIEALSRRHTFFHENGCRISDHGLDRFYYASFNRPEIDRIIRKMLSGKPLNQDDPEKYKCAVMYELCKMNHKRGWTQQFHVGAMRNNNSRMFRLMGADTGWDSIGSPQDALKMSRFLDLLDENDQLARTILYNLNPADNEVMITMAGNFNDGTVPVKVQYGPAWWFLDQKNGMEKHLRDLSSMGLLSRFIGMVTDSRSFLSYPRHEYFRRVACNFIGEEVEKGLIPDDEDLLKTVIEGISYKNAKEYFGF